MLARQGWRGLLHEMKEAMTRKSADLDPKLVEVFLADMLKAPKVRIRKLEAGGKTYWIKSYKQEKRSYGKLAHAWLAKIVRKPIYRPMPTGTAKDTMQAELNKLRAFSRAGFKTPDIVFEHDLWAVFSHEGETLETDLAKLLKAVPDEHDMLLCQWARIMGKVHGAGLCHGRPHVRDIILNRGKWIFLDFEEIPEQVMEIETAQARDALLMFHLLASRIQNAKFLGKAMMLYKEEAPAKTIKALRQAVDELEWMAKCAEAVVRVKQWKDVVRFANAMNFLKQNLESV